MSMRVFVKLLTGMQKYLPGPSQDGTCEISIPDTTTVESLLGQLGIPADVPKMVLINRRHAKSGQALEDGDIVSVLQPIAGG